MNIKRTIIYLTLLIGAAAKGESSGPIISPLAGIDPQQIRSVIFTGKSTPVKGYFCTITNQDEIKIIFGRAAILTNQDMFITMCGNLAMADFRLDNGNSIARVEINADGSTIVITDPSTDKIILVCKDRVLALSCFELLKAHCRDVLIRIGNALGDCKDNYPFSDIENEANKAFQAIGDKSPQPER